MSVNYRKYIQVDHWLCTICRRHDRLEIVENYLCKEINLLPGVKNRNPANRNTQPCISEITVNYFKSQIIIHIYQSDRVGSWWRFQQSAILKLDIFCIDNNEWNLLAPTSVNRIDPITTLAFSRNFGFSQHFLQTNICDNWIRYRLEIRKLDLSNIHVLNKYILVNLENKIQADIHFWHKSYLVNVIV
jgi:hypothetical protein